jgi:hypothetical protein
MNAKQQRYYKVLNADGSAPYGDEQFVFSLPTEDSFGDWHELTKPLIFNDTGFHLTQTPRRWAFPGMRVFEVEYENAISEKHGDDDDEICVAKVRLTKEVFREELEALNIYSSGHHRIMDGIGYAYNDAIISAFGRSFVEAKERARVVASGFSVVLAYNETQAKASGNCRIEAFDNSTVIAEGQCRVICANNAKVKVYGKTIVEASEDSDVEAFHSSIVFKDIASNVRVTLHDKALCLEGGVITCAEGSGYAVRENTSGRENG